MTELEDLRAYLLAKRGTVEEYPFGPEAMVFKVMGKMFALVSWQNAPLTINVKCDPALAVAQRETYAAVRPGYHMNKRHWNTLTLDDTIPSEEVQAMIDDSYLLVVKGLKKADREELHGNS